MLFNNELVFPICFILGGGKNKNLGALPQISTPLATSPPSPSPYMQQASIYESKLLQKRGGVYLSKFYGMTSYNGKDICPSTKWKKSSLKSYFVTLHLATQ